VRFFKKYGKMWEMGEEVCGSGEEWDESIKLSKKQCLRL